MAPPADNPNEAIVATLKQERKNIKSKFTRFITFYTDAANDENFNELQNRLNNIDGLLCQFETVQSKIEAITKDDSSTEIEEFENSFFEHTARVRAKLNAHRARSTPRSSQPIDNSNVELNAVRSNEATTGSLNVRLPKLDLPTFNGDCETWLSFYDSFKAIIHDNDKLVPVQKLHYLRSCLRDDAAKVINALETSAANYTVAWDLIKERYDDRRIITINHVKSILELPGYYKESAVNLRTLIDNTQMHLRALKSLGEDTDHWSTLLICILGTKLDRNTHREWEKSVTDKKMPKFETFIEFLQKRCQVLEATTGEPGNKSYNHGHNHATSGTAKRQNLATTRRPDFCNYCKGEHKIYNCEKFQNLSIQERRDAVKTAGLCFNCLRKGHRSCDCTLSKCKTCNRRHHTLLHTDEEVFSGLVNLQAQVATQVMLSTALIDINGKNGAKIPARVVLDSGSQSNFMTERFAKLLKIQYNNVNIPVEGLNQMETKINYSLTARIQSKITEFTDNLEFLIIPEICDALPLQFIDRRQIDIPNNLKLADPEFHKPEKIDALLGAEIFYNLLLIGQIRLTKHPALWQKTKLGWVLAGKLGTGIGPPNKIKNYLTIDPLHKQMTRFWEIEEIPDQRFLSDEESAVEKHFKANVQRDLDGRYIVKLPFNDKKEKLGDSRKMAERRFFALERKFKQNDSLKHEYVKFMREYEDLGHMKKVPNSESLNDGYFLPHHAVIKNSSNTTKVRVVYDGSAKTSSGVSLNDALKVGPTIQNTLFDIIIRSRSHEIVLFADIEKMYRMVKVDKNDVKYQRILWRENPQRDLEVFELNTVTYGTASAPFLATRALHELADNERENYPRAAEILKRDFYVDDLCTGANTREEAILLRDGLVSLLNRGGFKLRQWCSNDIELIKSLPNNLANIQLFSDESSSIKTLGIQWDPRNDVLTYTINDTINNTRVTKRIMLSQIAQLFDPIGLLGPVIIKAKILMQSLWKTKCDWDESVSPDIHTAWINYKGDLSCLNEVQFPRKIIIEGAKNIQIHGFCDASEIAYGACIYIRSQNARGDTFVNLLCSKTRVAPLKSLTIPRLELCAALLLANLLNNIQEALHIKVNDVYLWSDSTITLQWINTQPYLLKTFVANRVAQIRNITNASCWRHVSSKQNPADMLSRGQAPREFICNTMWVEGPGWLKMNENHWPSQDFENVPSPDLKANINLLSNTSKIKVIENGGIKRFLNRFSSLEKTKRVVGYCMRFINKSRKLADAPHIHGNEAFSVDEMNNATNKLIILLQHQHFLQEINALNKKSELHPLSFLRPLNPFIDKQGLLRVGGRLKNSDLSYNEKYPMVLPKDSHITTLIIRTEHLEQFHSGVHATLNSVRENYWPINGVTTVKQVLRKCVKCFRAKPSGVNYVMGNLPEERTMPQTRPFVNSGVDYCGPFFIKEKKQRNTKKVKAYVAIFVCFATKACHMELVTDLTTDSFIACLKRFFARRGKSTHIHSDNATNFVGANKELTASLRELLESEAHNAEVSTFLQKLKIQWHFSPPRSPHFGGLWEAAVKSFKHHFYRSIDDKLFTYEEMNTYIIEIEAILNSRPITPLSTDPNDLRALSPAHFLIGGSLLSIPEYDVSGIKINRLSIWQNVQRIKQYFWKRWYKEYLNHLNPRSKWQTASAKAVEVGNLVLIKEDNIPPLHWPLARITETHPGNDGVVRVVTVRTSTGIYKRCVKRICPLPIE